MRENGFTVPPQSFDQISGSENGKLTWRFGLCNKDDREFLLQFSAGHGTARLISINPLKFELDTQEVD